MVAFSRDPALAIWQAMKPLAEVGARTDAPDIAKIVTEAEIILFVFELNCYLGKTKRCVEDRARQFAAIPVI